MSHCKGFSSFDSMFSLLPLVMMLLFVMELSSHITHDAAEKTHRQQLFNKVVSIADYTVKSGAVRKDGEMKYPNWLDELSISKPYTEGLRERAGLSRLEISIQEPQENFPVCIYRIVVLGDHKKPARLYVCGE